MSTLILNGRETRDSLMPGLIERVKSLSRAPVLVIVQVGSRPDSSAFIKAKNSFAKKIGVEVKNLNLPETVTQRDLIAHILKFNADESIQGIIMQLPLPIHIDREAVIEAIDPKKDVDALTSFNVKRWVEGREGTIMPATARGIRTLLNQYKIDMFGKKVVVVGRSMLVGKPITAMCLNENATVTVCHSKTPDLASETRPAHVLIVAAGSPGLVGRDHVRTGQIIVDVGINTIKGEKLDDEIEGTRLVGDVDFENVKDSVAAISPVPGGVGPMTVFSLFENLLDLCKNPY